MLSILDTWIESKWDQRRWELALKSDKPVDIYKDMVQAARDEKSTPKIDELSKEEQDWLRNTG